MKVNVVIAVLVGALLCLQAALLLEVAKVRSDVAKIAVILERQRP